MMIVNNGTQDRTEAQAPKMRDTGTQNEVRIMGRTKGGKGNLMHAWPTIDAVNDLSITTVESTAITVELSNAS